MPVNSVGRPIESDLIKGLGEYQEMSTSNVYFKTISVGLAGEVDNIGLPVIWDDTAGEFRLYVAQNIATAKATGTSPLAGTRVLALTVGNKFGRGYNNEDTDATVAADFTAIFRGNASIVNEGIQWGSAAAPAQALFLKELEDQLFTVVPNADVVSPTYAVQA